MLTQKIPVSHALQTNYSTTIFDSEDKSESSAERPELIEDENSLHSLSKEDGAPESSQ